MGCDIHIVLERKVGEGPWLGLRELAFMNIGGVRIPCPARARNYTRFAALAGARGDGPEPKGMPVDASALALHLVDNWGSDGHSHSYIGLHDACKLWLATENDSWMPGDERDAEKERARRKERDKEPAQFYFGLWSDEVEQHEHRLVYWFDN